MKDKLTIFLATGGWIGFSPVAPGTFGSLAGIPFCWLLSLLNVKLAVVVLVFFIWVSIWAADATEKGEGEKDPKQVVIDEICGMGVTLFALPFTPSTVICGFALFRLFDISKPFPIRWLERKLPGGVGIVTDDLVAGLISHLLLRFGSTFLAVG